MLAPLSVKVPLPLFVRPPVPLMAPEKVVEVLSPPVFKVPLPSSTLPAPASEPMVLLKLFRSYVAPLATLTLSAELEGTPSALPSLKVPALMVVAPL